MIGKTLAHYEITSQIGKGGMGEVYQAKDTKLGRDVAIKVLPQEFAQDTDRVARFQREAKLLASLNHPNIAAIYGLEESDGTNFLVMELVEGVTLEDYIAGNVGVLAGKNAAETAALPGLLKLALQIDEALEAAHEKGVIHRDLKPANIKVTPDGKVKVLDFGLAKAFAGEQSDLSLSNSPTLSQAATMQGIILGTAAYMSPEQARGKAVDKRTDIWAFGCVLYEMLTGKAAFQGEDVTEILAAVVKSEVDLDLLPANIHPRVREVIIRCLQKDQKKRYRDIGDAQYEIEQVLADPSGVFVQPETIADQRTGIRTILPWVAAVILVGIIVGMAVWRFRTPEPPLSFSFYYELPEGQQFSNPLIPVLTISPDGRQFAYCTNGGLFLRRHNEMDAQLIAGTANENPASPIFSPDGKWIAYVSLADNKLKKIPIEGGSPADLCAINFDTPAFSGWWTGDKIIFSSFAAPGIMQVSANGGTAELLVDKEEATSYLMPQMLPDRKSVLFTKADNQLNRSIMVRSLESAETKELTAGFAARYLPSGHLVFTKGESVMNMSTDLYAVSFDVNKLEVTGDPFPIGITVSGIGGCFYAISDSGTLVYIGEDKLLNAIVQVDREGKEQPIPAASLNGYLDLRISPDETRVATSYYDDEGNQDIYILDLNYGGMERCTYSEIDDFAPVWTPDSKTIIYISQLPGVEEAIYRRAANGTGDAEQLVSDPDRVLLPWSLSSDGKILLVMGRSNAEGIPQWDIGMLSMEGDRSIKWLLQSKFNETYPVISPDMNWMAYVSNDSGQNKIYVRPFPDVNKDRKTISTGNGESPLWSPNGEELFYITGDAVMVVPVIESETDFIYEKPQPLFHGTFFSYTVNEMTDIPWDIHPDGKSFLMLKPTSEDNRNTKINVITNFFEELKEKVPVP
jgi:serine/threonine protein kinase